MFNLLLNFRWEIGEKMSSDRYYGDKALEYDNRRFGTNAGKMIYQLEKNTFTSLVRSVIVDNSRILEIATGTGRFIEILLGINNSVQICATDVSNEMITIAKDRVTKLNYNVDFINVDMMKLLDLIDISKYDLTFWVRIFTLLSKEKVLEFIEKICK
jgi:ubiquinone/menaquinone biosynthesis C-methylase UbiE